MYASLIDPVTQALRQALDIAVHFDRSTQEREKLRAVLRKLLVIREMHSSFFVCIGGTQGAGRIFCASCTIWRTGCQTTLGVANVGRSSCLSATVKHPMPAVWTSWVRKQR